MSARLPAYNGNAVESGQWSGLSPAAAGLDESDSTPAERTRNLEKLTRK